MPYIGRDLNRGNYLKLDDISSSFNGNTQTFNLTVGGSAFTPGSAFSILVSVGGVIQEPESAYQVENSEITFANAPTAQDSFFCIALGVALGIGVPGNGTVNGAHLAKPFNYDGYFYLDDTNNRVGIGSLAPTSTLDVRGDAKISGILTATSYSGPISNPSGISTFYDLRVSNNLIVEGTTTTLDTNVTGVDRIEINANSNTDTAIVGIQSGTADIVNLYDGTTKVLTVKDGGSVRVGDNATYTAGSGSDDLVIGATTGQHGMTILTGNNSSSINFADNASTNPGAITYQHNGTNYMRFRVAGSEIMRIKQGGAVGIGTEEPIGDFTILTDGNGYLGVDGGGGKGAEINIYNKDTKANTFKLANNGGSNELAQYSLISGSGKHVWHIGGTTAEKMRLTTTGLGIGTDPSYRLDVNGITRLKEQVYVNGNFIELNNSGDSQYTLNKGGTQLFSIRNNSTAGVHINTQNSALLCLGVSTGSNNGTVESTLSINHQGRVGINDQYPDGALDVNGQTHLDDVSISGVTTTSDMVKIVSDRNALSDPSVANNYHLHLRNPNNDLNETVGIAFGLSTGGDIGAAITHEREGSTSFGNLRFYTKESGSAASMLERMRIAKDGNVGIATDNPGAILDVLTSMGRIKFNNSGSIGSRIDFANANGTVRSSIHNYGGSNEILAFDAPSNIQFRISNSPKVAILSSGNVGIGSESPGRPLTITAADARIRLQDSDTGGHAEIYTDNSHSLHFGADSSSSSGSSNMLFEFNGTEAVRIRESGGDILYGSGDHIVGASAGLINGLGSHHNDNVGSVLYGVNDGGGFNGMKVENFDDGTYNSQRIKFLTGKGGYSMATVRMGINENGQVSIGSTTTTEAGSNTKLVVLGSGTPGVHPSTIAASTIATFRMTGGLSHSAGISILGGNTGSSVLNFGDRDNELIGRIVYNHTSGNTTDYMDFYVQGDDKLRIESSGNIRATSGTQFKGFHLVKADGGTVAQLVGHGSDNDEGGVNLWDGGTKKVQILANGTSYLNGGKVGIGSEIPNSKLEVWNNANIEVLRLKDTHFNKYLTIRGGGTPNRMVIDSYEGGGGGAAIDLASNGSTKLRIESSGNVNIGVNASSNPFTYLRFGATLYGAADIRPTDEASHKVGLAFYTDGTQDTTINPTEKVRITSGGKVGINQLSNIQTRLHVSENIADSTAVNWANSTMTLSSVVGGNSTANRSTLYFAPYNAANQYCPSAISCTAGGTYESTLKFFTNGHGNGTGHLEAYERVRINSYGQVGINTTVGGLVAVAVDSSNTNPLATGGIALSLKNTNTTDNSWVCMDFNNSVGGIVGRIGAQFTDTSDKDTDLYFATRSDGGALTERLRIDSNGVVTISNSSPPATGAMTFITDDGSATTLGSAATLRVANNGGSASYSVFEAESSAGSLRLANDGRFYITGTDSVENDAVQTVYISDTASYNAVPQSGISFRHKYHSNGAFANMAGIVGKKENNSNGDYGGELYFFTRTNGVAPTKRFAVGTEGVVRGMTGTSFSSAHGAKYSNSYDTAGWGSGTFQDVIPNATLVNGRSYLITFYWTHHGSGAPYILSGNFLFRPNYPNSSGTSGPTHTPFQTAHTTHGTSRYFQFAPFAGGYTASQGIRVAPTWSIVNNSSTAGTFYIYAAEIAWNGS